VNVGSVMLFTLFCDVRFGYTFYFNSVISLSISPKRMIHWCCVLEVLFLHFFKKRHTYALWGINMKRSLKIASIIGLVLLLLGASVLVYGTMQTTNDKKDNGPPDNRPPANRPPENRPPSVLPGEEHFGLNFEQLKFFLNHATAVKINGSVVALVKGMLILNTLEGHVTILLPENWTVDSMVVNRETLFNGTFSGVDQNVTVKALKSVLFEHDNFSINVIIGYEIINANGIHAYALLPFNIETKP